MLAGGPGWGSRWGRPFRDAPTATSAEASLSITEGNLRMLNGPRVSPEGFAARVGFRTDWQVRLTDGAARLANTTTRVG